MKIYGAHPIQVIEGAGGVTQLVFLGDEIFIVQVNAVSSDSPPIISWTEMLHNGSNTYIVKPSGRVGTLTSNPAFAAGSSPSVGDIGLLSRGFLDPVLGQQFVYFGGGGNESSATFPASIDGFNGVSIYSWTERSYGPGGTFPIKSGGRTGTPGTNPAYDQNDAKLVRIGSIVNMQKGYLNPGPNGLQEYVFDGTRPIVRSVACANGVTQVNAE